MSKVRLASEWWDFLIPSSRLREASDIIGTRKVAEGWGVMPHAGISSGPLECKAS
jgi:hypothetical protein